MPRFEWMGQQLEPLSGRALLWIDRATMILADPHFGKGQTFRNRGIPVPSGSTSADIHRLAKLMRLHEPARLVILGDFFHTRESQSAEVLHSLEEWRGEFPQTEVTLVRGNHDRHAGDPPASLGIRAVSEPYSTGPFSFCHFPQATRGYTLAGHLHPSVQIRNGRQKLTNPCFVFGQETAILPAFGSFTGSCRITPDQTDRIFLVIPNQVMEIPVELVSGSKTK